ncbi:MAG: DUF2586 family protein [Prevotellaceae bacterium]|jgi:hypothetical protein|nr:DUF2586 family protein [Prevotellaceae bacterium]
MGVPGVTFKYLNGQLGGTNPTADGVCGLVIQVPEAPEGLALGVSKALYSLSDAETVGLTAAYDQANGVIAYGEIRDFFGKTSGKGELWVMLVVNTTSVADICDAQNLLAAKLLADSQGRIRVWGVATNRPAAYEPTTTNGIDHDIYAAANKAQELRTNYALNRYIPTRVVLPGRAFTGEASALLDLKQIANNGVLISLHGRKNSKEGMVGFLLGLIASLPVQRNIGRVRNGALGVEEAYLTDGVTRAEDIFNTKDVLHDKGYVFPITRVGRAGYYYNDDQTATGNTDDYHSLANGRVIDKVQRIAYDVYLDSVNDDFELSLKGKIGPAALKALQGDVEDAVNTIMASSGELSSFRCYVDPEQDTIGTGKTVIRLNAQPRGYFKEIEVELGFVKTQE